MKDNLTFSQTSSTYKTSIAANSSFSRYTKKVENALLKRYSASRCYGCAHPLACYLCYTTHDVLLMLPRIQYVSSTGIVHVNDKTWRKDPLRRVKSLGNLHGQNQSQNSTIASRSLRRSPSFDSNVDTLLSDVPPRSTGSAHSMAPRVTIDLTGEDDQTSRHAPPARQASAFGDGTSRKRKRQRPDDNCEPPSTNEFAITDYHKTMM